MTTLDFPQMIVPCIWLDDAAEEAASFYVEVFGAGRIVATSRYPESFDNPGKKPRGSVLTVEADVAGQRFTFLNGGPMFKPNPSISFFAQVGSPAEVDRIFGRLEKGGSAVIALGEYPWSKRYGWVQDRYGVSWQVGAGFTDSPATSIMPCLMFSGPRRGRAEAALQKYAATFPGGRVDAIHRYEAGEGPEGNVKHGRAVLAGQEIAAMDSHADHDDPFSEAVSLQVMCDDQAQVDSYWEVLAQGGQHGPCGWLKDAFGVSWQVVPKAMGKWMTHPDPRARDRAFAAMLEMKKLDIGRLESALACA